MTKAAAVAADYPEKEALLRLTEPPGAPEEAVLAGMAEISLFRQTTYSVVAVGVAAV